MTCEYYALVFKQTTGAWQVSRRTYRSPAGIMNGVRRLEKESNSVANPLTLVRAIHTSVDPETGLSTSGIYKEFQL